MDNQRPQLDLKFYKDICPDQNGVSLQILVTVSNSSSFEVPVIVVFTKHDQFLRNVQMHLLDYPSDFPDGNVSEVAEKQFQEHYPRPLGDDVKYVQLKSRFRVMCQCHMLMLFDRNAHEREPLRYSYWEDGWSAERRCCRADAFSCAKGQLRVEC